MLVANLLRLRPYFDPLWQRPYGVVFACLTYSCCGQNFPYCYFTGPSCNGSGKLNDPAIQQRLHELAKTQDVMVASCDGNYHPLSTPTAERRDLDLSKHELPGISGAGK